MSKDLLKKTFVESKYKYNSDGQLVYTSRKDSSKNEFEESTSEYDSNGNLKLVYKKHYIDGVKKWTETKYEAGERVLEENQDGIVYEKKYLEDYILESYNGGSPYKEPDSYDLYVYDYQYDASRKVLLEKKIYKGTVKYDSSGWNFEQRVIGPTTEYEYDSKDNLVAQNTSNGISVLYEYDENGNLVLEKKIDKSKTDNYRKSEYEHYYKYDQNNKLVFETMQAKAQNWEKEYEYDDSGRLIGENFKQIFSTYYLSQKISYEYDENGALLSVKTIPLWTSGFQFSEVAIEPETEVYYEYYASGKLLRKTEINQNTKDKKYLNTTKMASCDI